MLEIINLNKSYGKNRVLTDINLKIEENKIYGLLGSLGMDSINRIFKFQLQGLKKTVIGFWSVIFIINIGSYALTSYFYPKIKIGLFSSNDDLISIVGSNLMPIFIFFIVYGILIYHEDFSLALNFGATRKDYYKSTIISNLLVVLIFAIIQSIIQIVDKHLITSIGLRPLTDFGMFNTATDNIFYIILVFSMIFLALSSITNLLGVFQYRFGYKFWIGFGLLFIVVQILTGGLIIKFMIEFKDVYLNLLPRFKGSTIIITSCLITVICYSIGYFLFRKVNIKR